MFCIRIYDSCKSSFVVPGILSLKDLGYGNEKGISTVALAATSLDDVLAISLFGVFLEIGLSAMMKVILF